MRAKAIISAMAVAMSALQASAEASVAWVSTVHDFGAFDEDTKEKTAKFKLVNTGDEPVAIISATATCGCTTPKYSDAEIMPGDTATVTVTYDPSGRPGRFQKQVYVRTTASPERYKLTLKGTVIGSAETIGARYPMEIGRMKLRNGAAMMGKATAGHDKMHYVDGYNQSSDTIIPTVSYAPAYIEVKSTPEKVAPGDMMSLDFRFIGDGGADYGILSDSVMIADTPDGIPVSFPIVTIVEEDFTILTPAQLASAPKASYSTDKIMLEPVAEGAQKAVSAKAQITNEGIDDLIIRRIYTQDPGLSVKINADKIKKGKSADIEVIFDPSAQPTGIINARITIITNDPSNPTQTIRVVGARE